MSQPLNPKQSYSSSDKIKIAGIILFLAILLVVFGFLVGLLLRRNGFKMPSPVIKLRATSPASAAIAPTLLIPTVDCGSPTLALGSSTFQIQNVAPAADGSLT